MRRVDPAASERPKRRTSRSRPAIDRSSPAGEEGNSRREREMRRRPDAKPGAGGFKFSRKKVDRDNRGKSLLSTIGDPVTDGPSLILKREWNAELSKRRCVHTFDSLLKFSCTVRLQRRFQLNQLHNIASNLRL